MKKTIKTIITIFVVSSFFYACGGEQKSMVKAESAAQDNQMMVKSGGADDLAITAINGKVQGFSISGFPGGSSKISKSKNLAHMKKIVKLVKPIIETIPEGYVMQITGHTAEFESDSKRQKVSGQRALTIYNELKKSGVAASKMTHTGVGSSEPIEGISNKDIKQRRVSFRAVKK